MNKKQTKEKTMRNKLDKLKSLPNGNRRYNVYVSDMFLDTKQPKKHQERFIRKLLGDEAYYKRWRDKQLTKGKQ
tara:strand:- start:909 stop:1130 length:222 start_codon:yes stop_codon:yes gene_type:complete